jgi:hypothetical protein
MDAETQEEALLRFAARVSDDVGRANGINPNNIDIGQDLDLSVLKDLSKIQSQSGKAEKYAGTIDFSKWKDLA